MVSSFSRLWHKLRGDDGKEFIVVGTRHDQLQQSQREAEQNQPPERRPRVLRHRVSHMKKKMAARAQKEKKAAAKKFKKVIRSSDQRCLILEKEIIRLQKFLDEAERELRYTELRVMMERRRVYELQRWMDGHRDGDDWDYWTHVQVGIDGMMYY